MPLINSEIIEDIRASTDITTVISDHVELRQRGRNSVGLCPFHDERTPSFNVDSDKQLYHCFGCGVGGDVFQFVQEVGDVPFIEAVRFLAEREGIELPKPLIAGQRRLSRSEKPPRPHLESSLQPPPSTVWQEKAEDVAQTAESALWAPEGTRALAYLRGRGFVDETIVAARLGYVPGDRHEAPELWGLPGHHSKVWLPRGISIPWRSYGSFWRLNVRRPTGKPKYCGPAGSANGVYGADGLRPGCPVVLCEGEFDALAVAQEAGDLVIAVATGSTSGSRHRRWTRALTAVPIVLVAYDANEAGERAAPWWLDAIPGSKRLVPEGDPAKMLEIGSDLREWVTQELCSEVLIPSRESQ